MDLINHPSPNHDSREGQMIDMLVLHYTGMQTLQAAIARLTDPKAKVSAHYLVTVSGDLICMVDEGERAWHAGVSNFNGRENCNEFSIGIELEGTDELEYTQEQYDSLVEVSRELMVLYPLITKGNIVGHCDIAPGRKTDPGETFDWDLYLSRL